MRQSRHGRSSKVRAATACGQRRSALEEEISGKSSTIAPRMVDPHSGVKISFDCATSERREIYYGVDSFQSLHGNASAFHS